MDDNKKKYFPQLAIDTEFFHSAFALYDLTPKSQSERCAPYCIECLMAKYCMRWRGIFEGLS
jgi:hypothetical protein